MSLIRKRLNQMLKCIFGVKRSINSSENMQLKIDLTFFLNFCHNLLFLSLIFSWSLHATSCLNIRTNIVPRFIQGQKYNPEGDLPSYSPIANHVKKCFECEIFLYEVLHSNTTYNGES